jgi:hypothetical protein
MKMTNGDSSSISSNGSSQQLSRKAVKLLSPLAWT